VVDYRAANSCPVQKHGIEHSLTVKRAAPVSMPARRAFK
jgi:hypothetical protein